MSDAQIPGWDQLAKYSVNRDGWEGIRQTLFDSAIYPAAGSTQLSFFSTPIGQGTSAFTGVKTASDTNMTLAGQLPANQYFLATAIEVLFLPATPTVTAGMPAAFGAQAVAASVNDAYIFRRSGNFNLTVGSKPYLQDAPMMKFPATADFKIDAALADVSSAAASLQSRIAYGRSEGRPYILNPGNILIPSNQNFGVTLSWPEGLQAIANPARVMVSFQGYLYRRSQ